MGDKGEKEVVLDSLFLKEPETHQHHIGHQGKKPEQGDIVDKKKVGKDHGRHTDSHQNLQIPLGDPAGGIGAMGEKAPIQLLILKIVSNSQKQQKEKDGKKAHNLPGREGKGDLKPQSGEEIEGALQNEGRHKALENGIHFPAIEHPSFQQPNHLFGPSVAHLEKIFN